MPIAISCSQCDWKGKVADNLAGKKGKCPTCGELIPIKKSSGPPPLARGKTDDESDIVDDADVVEDEPRPKKSASRGRDDEDDDRPARSRRRDDEDDDRPRKRRRDEDDEDDRPAKSRRR